MALPFPLAKIPAALLLTLVAWLLCAGSTAWAADPDTPFPVGIVLNGQDTGCSALAYVMKGELLARRSDLDTCGVPLPISDGDEDESKGGRTIGQDRYIALARLPGLEARLDPAGEFLLIDADAERFGALRYGWADTHFAVTPAIPAVRLDYVLNFSEGSGERGAASAYVDMAVSGGWGVISSSALAGTGPTPDVRLDTAYTLDFPQRQLRLVAGDTLTRGATWSQPVRFAGLRLGTDFTLAPGRLTYPLPTLEGGSALPSTASLATSEGMRSLALEPGRFSYAYRPSFNGAGDVTMTVRDIAGNQQTITRSFYLSTSQLRRGISEFSLEAGFLRQAYGLRSADYGAPALSAWLRRGLSDTLTLESRIEASNALLGGGAGVQVLLQPLGELRVAGALSSDKGELGALLQVQAQRITPHYSATASYRLQSAPYRQVGEPHGIGSARSELALSGSIVTGRDGAFTLGLIDQHIGSRRTSIASANYSLTLGQASINLGVQHLRTEDGHDTWVSGALTLPLGRHQNMTLQADNDRLFALYERADPTGAGTALRLGAGREMTTGTPWTEGEATLRTQSGDLRVAALMHGGRPSGRIEAQGSAIAADGQLWLAQRGGDAVAVVHVAGDIEGQAEDIEPGSGILLENRKLPATGGRAGRALVPGLVPYAPNRIAVDPRTLPIEVPLGNAETTVIPGWGKAVRVTFGEIGALALRIRVLDPSGRPVPAGLEVVLRPASVSSSEAAAPPLRTVTGNDGEVFLERFVPGAVLHVAGPGRLSCTVKLGAAAPRDGLTAPLIATCHPATAIAEK